MKRNSFVSKMTAATMAALLTTGVSTAGAAEIWSSPTYTEQWSTPVYTEQWSNPQTPPQNELPPAFGAATPATTTAMPAQPATPEKPSHYIRLQLGSKQAVIQDQTVPLDVPPLSMNGRTMVPFRFLADALGAEVEWDPNTQRILLAMDGKTIVLQVNQPAAMVDGQQVNLDAPPVITDGRTLVPLRFVSENLNLPVTFTPGTNTIEIGNPPETGTGETTSGAGKTLDREPITDFEKLYGTWKIWIPGSAANLYWTDTGNYATHVYTPGAASGTVTIYADGTYEMDHGIWGKAGGKWRLTFPREINGDIVMGIVLQQGPGGDDWAAAPSEDGDTVRLLSSAGTWADGSTMWLFNAELYR